MSAHARIVAQLIGLDTVAGNAVDLAAALITGRRRPTHLVSDEEPAQVRANDSRLARLLRGRKSSM
jgi:hypothetical protein